MFFNVFYLFVVFLLTVESKKNLRIAGNHELTFDRTYEGDRVPGILHKLMVIDCLKSTGVYECVPSNIIPTIFQQNFLANDCQWLIKYEVWQTGKY